MNNYEGLNPRKSGGTTTFEGESDSDSDSVRERRTARAEVCA